MKRLKTIGLGVIAGLALTALLGVATAAATTLEVGGVTKNASVTINGSLKPETSAVFKNTAGSIQNTCTKFEMHGSTQAPYSGTQVGGAATSWEYGGCTRPITNHKPGEIYGEHIAGTTNGTFFSNGAETTASIPFFGYVLCKTEGTHIGTATGVASGQATVHFHASVNCGVIWAVVEGSGVITSPEGLGGSA